MALLDVLSVVFEADADRLKKGAGEAEEVLEETKDAIVDTDKAAESLGESFLDAIGSAKGAIAGLLSIGAVTASVVAQAAATDQLGKFSQRIGENIEDVGAWGEAVTRSGGSMEGFQGTIETLTDSLTELSITGGGDAAETLAMLGIAAFDSAGQVKSAFDLLPEIAESFEGLTAAESANLGKKLGLDQGTILLLQQGRNSVEELVARQKSLGVVTNEDAKIAADFNDAVDDLGQVFGSVTRMIGAYLLPALTGTFKGIENIVLFMVDNKPFVIAFFTGIAAVVSYFYLPAILKAAAATLGTVAPFIAVGAAIGAVVSVFALLVDDIYTFIQGGDSLTAVIIGKVVKSFEEFKQSVLETWETFKGFFDFFSDNGNMVVQASQNAQVAIESAQKNPLAGQTARDITATSRHLNRHTSVSVAAVNVDARGGDSAEISHGVGLALREEMERTVSNFDDGINY